MAKLALVDFAHVCLCELTSFGLSLSFLISNPCLPTLFNYIFN